LPLTEFQLGAVSMRDVQAGNQSSGRAATARRLNRCGAWIASGGAAEPEPVAARGAKRSAVRRPLAGRPVNEPATGPATGARWPANTPHPTAPPSLRPSGIPLSAPMATGELGIVNRPPSIAPGPVVLKAIRLLEQSAAAARRPVDDGCDV
jgi:hypothetical protein